MYRQNWTLKKIICYALYRAVLKHVPRDLPLLGGWFHHLRRIVCRPLFRKSDRNISIGRGVSFDNGCSIIMKEYANLGAYAQLSGNHATITIGRHVMMGINCMIISQNHKFRFPEGYDGFEGKNVIIEDYVWIGNRVIILPGVTIGKHAIIGAGSVVPRNIPDYAIAVGNPAVVKRYRNQSASK